MRNIAFEVVAAVNVVDNVRMKYLLYKDRLELNTNRKLHERIFKIYSIAVPEFVNAIFNRLGFSDCVIWDDCFILTFKSILNNADSLWELQNSYEHSEIKQEIEALCDNLTNCVWETVVTLKTLETTL